MKARCNVILLIDNYDSFTYNLLQYLAEIGEEIVVYRNDAIGVDQIEALKPDGIVISPGPGRPQDAGISMEVIRTYGPRIPSFGVCLGHQAIGEVYGGRVVRAPEPVHGKTSMIKHDGKGVFDGLENPLEATRYHSLIVERESLPDELEITAETDGLIMGMRHKVHPIESVQFHPESILTKVGKDLLRNFVTGAVAAKR